VFRERQNGVFVAGAGRGTGPRRRTHARVESRSPGVPFVI
jgi:hypothetical protein